MLPCMFTMQEWAVNWLTGLVPSYAKGRKTPEQLQAVVRRCRRAMGSPGNKFELCSPLMGCRQLHEPEAGNLGDVNAECYAE